MSLKKLDNYKIFILSLLIFVIFFTILELLSFIILSKLSLIKKEYYPLIKESKISTNEFEQHLKNIKKANRKYYDIREYHPQLIYIYRPNLDYDTFKTNSLGIMDEEINHKKEKILLIGSSVVNGGLRQGYVENIDAHLENILNNENKNFQVLNAGIGGYTSFQEKNFLEIYKKKIKPDHVIYMSSANDVDSKYRITNKYDKNIVRFYDNFHSLNLRFQIDNLLKLKSSAIVSTKTYIPYFIKSLNMYKLYIRLMSYSVNSEAEYIKTNLEKKDYEIIKSIVDEYILNVEKMAKIIENDKTIKTFTVGIQPNIFTKKIKTKNEKIAENIILNYMGYNYRNYYIFSQKLMLQELKKIQLNYQKLRIINTHSIFDNNKIDVFRDNVHFFDYSNEEIAYFLSKNFN